MQTDIDCLAADRTAKKLLIGECKWRNEFDESQALEGLVAKKSLVPHYEANWFWLFSKHPVAKATARRHRGDASVRCVSLEDLYA